jgi:hypothetical protein
MSAVEMTLRAKWSVMRAFETEMESHLARDLEALEHQRDETLNKIMVDSTLAQRWDSFDQFLKREFTFPNLLRTSLFLSCYSLFEDLLAQLCRAVEAVATPRVRLEDLRGSGVVRSRLFLERVASIPFPDPDALWQDIDRLRLARNCLAHENGRVRDRSGALGRFLAGRDDIALDEGGRIIVRQGFNGWATDRFETLLLRVALHVPLRMS